MVLKTLASFQSLIKDDPASFPLLVSLVRPFLQRMHSISFPGSLASPSGLPQALPVSLRFFPSRCSFFKVLLVPGLWASPSSGSFSLSWIFGKVKRFLQKNLKKFTCIIFQHVFNLQMRLFKPVSNKFNNFMLKKIFRSSPASLSFPYKKEKIHEIDCNPYKLCYTI